MRHPRVLTTATAAVILTIQAVALTPARVSAHSATPAKPSRHTATGVTDVTGTVGGGKEPGTASPAAVPAAVPDAPTIVAVTADQESALLTWNAAGDGGAPILGYLVTPYVAGVPQPAQSYVGTDTTRTVSGLTRGTTYAFTVAARNADGVGAESARSMAVTPNLSPNLEFPDPPAATVGVAYRFDLIVDHGVRPYTWSTPGGGLPPGMTVSPSAGTLSGIPTAAGSYDFLVRVTDALGRSGTRRTTVDVNTNPQLNFPAPPLGEVGAVYTDQLTVEGGQAPFVWSLSSGALPPGLSLDRDAGTLTGTPVAPGAFGFVVRVSDAANRTSYQSSQIVIQEASVVTLSTSVSDTNFGTRVPVLAQITPGLAQGNITFTARAPNGIEITLATLPVADNQVSTDLLLPAYGVNRITAQYSGSVTHAFATSNTVAVHVSAVHGQVLISQFRQYGLGGPTDQYLDLYNNTGQTLPIAGFAVRAATGELVTVPASAPPIGPDRHYLLAGPAYPVENIAPDVTNMNLGSGGLRVTAPDGLGTVTDAVGPTTGYSTGTPLPAFTSPPALRNAWVRLHSGGRLQDTQDNAADFRLVSVTGGVIGGVQSTLGTPSPQSAISPYQQNSSLQSTLLDPAVAAGQAPNQVYTRGVGGNPGTLVIRRTLTNRSANALTAAMLRIVALSQANGAPRPGVSTQPAFHANLRLLNPATATSTVTLTDGRTVTVRNLSMDFAATDPPGGGLSTTLSIPLPLGGIASGGSVQISLTFAVDSTGPFWLSYDIDALGGGAPEPIAPGLPEPAAANRSEGELPAEQNKRDDKPASQNQAMGTLS